jgi:methionyl-tRNA synthetase
MLGLSQEQWTGLKADTLRPGARLGTIEPLFPRIEKTVEELRSMDEKPIQAVGAGTTPAEDNRISIDEFMRVELRVAKVLEAEAVPKSKKLVKLKVDVGTEQRTIVAGIAEAYQPEQLVGRTIAIVFNLKPAKLMGIESNGMVLAASVDGGKPILVAFDQDVPPGARVR